MLTTTADQSLLLTYLADLGALHKTVSPNDGFVQCEFVLGPSAHKSLRKLRKEVNEDLKDDRLDAVIALAQVRAVPDHLIPLVEQHGALDADLLLETTKLLVQLTMPDQPSDHALACKAAVVKSPTALGIIVSQIHSPLSVDHAKRTEKQKMMLELVLWLTRNLLSFRSDDDSDFYQALQLESVFDICLHLAEHVTLKGNREWNLVLLDIFFNLFRGHSPENLGHTAPALEAASPQEDELSAMRNQARANKAALVRSLSSRHSRFGGLFSVRSESGVQKLRRDFVAKSAPVELTLPGRSNRRPADKSALPRSILQSAVKASASTVALVRDVLTHFVARAYSPLVETLVLDIRREDPRVLLADEVTFVWLIGFCQRFTRTCNGPGFDWVHSPLFKTMDLWTFVFVVGKVEANFESKSFAALETSVRTLLEMMLALEDVAKLGDIGKGLRNAVLYELHERLDMIHKLIKAWNRDVMSPDYLRDLVCLADVTLSIVQVMSDEGALKKQKVKEVKKKLSTEKKLMGTKWGAEETNALYEGVKELGSDVGALKRILKHPSYAGLFEENKRTFKQLEARWDVIRTHISGGKTLEALVAAEMDEPTAPEDEEQDEVAVVARLADAQIDFFSTLRPYMHNDVFLNLSRLVDPLHAKNFAESVADGHAHRLVAVFFRRLRAFDARLRPGESLEGQLWHVDIFVMWQRTLDALRERLRLVDRRAPGLGATRLHEGTRELVRVIESSLRRFFRHASQSPLAYIEALFWRTKGEVIAMSRFYKEPIKRGGQHFQAIEYTEDPSLADGEDEYVFGQPTMDNATASSSESEAEMDEEPEENGKKKQSSRAPPVKDALKRLVAGLVNSSAPPTLLTSLGDFLERAAKLPELLADLCLVPSTPAEDECVRTLEQVARVLLALGLAPPGRALDGAWTLENGFYWRLASKGFDPKKVALTARVLAEVVAEVLEGEVVAEQQEEAQLESVSWCLRGGEAEEVHRETSGPTPPPRRSSNKTTSSNEDEGKGESVQQRPTRRQVTIEPQHDEPKPQRGADEASSEEDEMVDVATAVEVQEANDAPLDATQADDSGDEREEELPKKKPAKKPRAAATAKEEPSIEKKITPEKRKRVVLAVSDSEASEAETKEVVVGPAAIKKSRTVVLDSDEE